MSGLRLAFCVLIWVSVGSSLFAESEHPQSSSSWSASVFDATDHDFGEVPCGATLRKVFVITNNLNQPIHISRIRAESHPVFVQWKQPSRDWIEPGDSIPLEVLIQTRAQSNKSNRLAVTVQFDRPDYSSTELWLSWVQRSDFVIYPKLAQLGGFKRGVPTTARMQIGHLGDRDWKITSAVSENAGLDVTFNELRRIPDKSGLTRVDFEIRVTPRVDIKRGPIDEIVHIESTDPRILSFDVLVEGRAE